MNRAFITGSRAYGEPTEKSDYDICMLVSVEDLEKLLPIVSDPGYNDERDTFQIKAGPLNLIVTKSQAVYDAWRAATNVLKAEAPIPRSVAVALIRAYVEVGRK